MKTIYIKEVIPTSSGRENLIHYEVIEHNGKKFLIYIEGSNCDYLGFNRKCCVKIMDDNGNWNNLVDNRHLGFSANNDGMYYGSNIDTKKSIVTYNVNEFKHYIETIY